MQIKAAILILSIYSFPALGAGIDVIGPDGMKLSCAILVEFEHGNLDASDVVFNLPRSSWTDRNTAFVRAASQQCYSQLQYNLMVSGRLTNPVQDDLIRRQKRVDSKAAAIVNENKRAADAARDDDRRLLLEEKRLAQESKIRAEDDVKRVVTAATEACNANKQHQLFIAQEDVIEFNNQLAEWRQKQQHEARIARVAGVRDLYAERANGEWIVQLTDNVRESFSEYRRLGGKSVSPQKVAHQVTDPCGSLSEK